MRALLPLVLLIGCAGDEATLQSHEEARDAAPLASGGTGCDYQQRAVDSDYTTAELSAPDTLAVLAVEQVHPMKWDSTGGLTTLSLSFVDPGNLREIRSVGTECPAYLLVDATAVLHTEDGRLDEVFEVSLRHEGHGLLWLERWVAMDQLSGTYVPRELSAVHTAADLEIVASLTTAGSTGALALYAQRDDGETDAWDVARWPADAQ